MKIQKDFKGSLVDSLPYVFHQLKIIEKVMDGKVP